MTFLKYIFNRTKPCLHNVKELASDRRSEKNLAEAERARPWTVKGARVLSDAGADPSEGRLPDPWNPGDPLRAGASRGAGLTGRTADQSLAWRSPRLSTVLWPRPHGCPRQLAIHSTNAGETTSRAPRGGKRSLLRALRFCSALPPRAERRSRLREPAIRRRSGCFPGSRSLNGFGGTISSLCEGSFIRSPVHDRAEFPLSATETKLTVEDLEIHMGGLVPGLRESGSVGSAEWLSPALGKPRGQFGSAWEAALSGAEPRTAIRRWSGEEELTGPWAEREQRHRGEKDGVGGPEGPGQSGKRRAGEVSGSRPRGDGKGPVLGHTVAPGISQRSADGGGALPGGNRKPRVTSQTEERLGKVSWSTADWRRPCHDHRQSSVGGTARSCGQESGWAPAEAEGRGGSNAI